MTTTRSQSKAMCTPQTSPTQLKPESPKSTSSQESPGSTISQESPESIPSQESPENTPSQDSPLSPGWVHAITIIMGYPLKSEIGQKLQKWVLYHLIHDPTNFGLSWHPTLNSSNLVFSLFETNLTSKT